MIAGLNLAYLQQTEVESIGERGSPDSEVVPYDLLLLGSTVEKRFGN